ncbi:MAG: hypothetical protein E7536_03520 [Ruminococcaceae bacterium]|nr:hypothetical protein [Oscillospiraceae bacterium]
MNWLWHGNADVVFRTYDERKKFRRKKAALIFVISGVAVILLTLFFLFLSVGFDVDRIINDNGGITINEEESGLLSPKEVTGQKNILMYCTDDSDEKITFLCAVRFNMDSKQIKVFPISATEKILPLNSKNVNATSCYNHAGVLQLVESVEKYTGVEFDKYIGCKEGSIEGIVANFDELKFNFPDDMTFEKDSDSITFQSGSQTISDDAIYKILTYSADGNTTALRATLVISMFTQYFNEANIENRDNIYANIISQVYSDISYIDFVSYKDYLVVLASDQVEKQYSAVSTVEEFTS